MATIDLRDLLEVVEEFGCASLELAAWEFSLPPAVLANQWARAASDGLLVLRDRPEGAADTAEGTEPEYVLSALGHAHLRELVRGDRGRRAECLTCGSTRESHVERCPDCGHRDSRIERDTGPLAATADERLLARIRETVNARHALHPRAAQRRSQAAEQRARALEVRLRAQIALLRARLSHHRHVGAEPVEELAGALREVESIVGD